jgi:hypothetical protein
LYDIVRPFNGPFRAACLIAVEGVQAGGIPGMTGDDFFTERFKGTPYPGVSQLVHALLLYLLNPRQTDAQLLPDYPERIPFKVPGTDDLPGLILQRVKSRCECL